MCPNTYLWLCFCTMRNSNDEFTYFRSISYEALSLRGFALFPFHPSPTNFAASSGYFVHTLFMLNQIRL